MNRMLLIPATGFALLLVGLMLNLLGWYVFDSRAVVVVSLVIGILGLGIGFIGILIGQVATLRHWFCQFNKKNNRDHKKND